MKINYNIILSVLFCFAACRQQTDQIISREEIRKTEEAMIGVNRMLVRQDKEMINQYVREQGLTMKETTSGLWYEIRPQTAGQKIQTGQVVTIQYSVHLLDGTVCYDSDRIGDKRFVVGQGGVESGLEEGILLMHKGDTATLIMPPHLAHGLQGDGNQIPARSIIIYHLVVKNVEFQ